MGRYADEEFGMESVDPPRAEYYMAIVFQVLSKMDRDWENVVDQDDSVAFQRKWRNILGLHYEEFPDGYNTPRQGIISILGSRFDIYG